MPRIFVNYRATFFSKYPDKWDLPNLHDFGVVSSRSWCHVTSATSQGRWLWGPCCLASLDANCIQETQLFRALKKSLSHYYHGTDPPKKWLFCTVNSSQLCKHSDSPSKHLFCLFERECWKPEGFGEHCQPMFQVFCPTNIPSGLPQQENKPCF